VDVAAYRERFPILADTTYLINHSLAAMPAEAEDNLTEYARMWKTRGIRSWGEGWWDMPLTVGDQVGRIVGAPAGSTCMHQNVTVAVMVVLSCFRLEPPRNRIVYVEGEFPSVRYLLQAQPGAEIEVVPDLDALVEAIDERTLLVPVSHVLYKVAELQDVTAVQRRAEEVGAHVLLDAYQSAGAVPLDVHRLGVSFATGGSVKWLCGGPGAGWLYVRPDLIDELEPSFVGWQGHARPFAFETELEYADGVARFLTGTPNVPALYAAKAGYDVIEEVGVDAIRRRSLDLTDHLIRLADHAGFEVTSQRDQTRRGASVTVRVPGFEGVHKELAERQILCDFRPEVGLRLGPHFFNTAEELDYAVGQVEDILASGVHERHLGAAARF
jgi:kynureninase